MFIEGKEGRRGELLDEFSIMRPTPYSTKKDAGLWLGEWRQLC